jgi:hypothetical protein
MVLVAISLGVGLGNAFSGLWAWYLVGTRDYRRVRNPWVLGFGYLLIFALATGSLLLLGAGVRALDFQMGSLERRIAMISYLVGISSVFGQASGVKSSGESPSASMTKPFLPS